MTFISTAITSQGIILAADSKELLEGGQLLWDDFADILKTKKIDEDDTSLSISASEIKEKFRQNSQLTQGRIRSSNGAKKIFQLGSHFAILVSGTANPGGKNFDEIVKDIEAKVSEKNFNKYLEISFSEINSLMSIEHAEGKPKSEIIFCGYDENDSSFKVYIFSFVDKYIMDEKGNHVRDEKGNAQKENIFKRNDRTQTLNLCGWTTHVLGLSTSINQMNLSLSLIDGFRLSKRIMDLVVAIESMSHSIPGIGGDIYYAVITTKGFYWVNSETDVMNLRA